MQTVNLSILANAFYGSAQIESNYKRLQRFLHKFEMPCAEFSRFVVSMLGLPGPYILALDQANRKAGVVDLNILVFSIVHRGAGARSFGLSCLSRALSGTSAASTIAAPFRPRPDGGSANAFPDIERSRP